MSVRKRASGRVNATDPTRRLRVLLVPSATQWIQGTKARAFARANPWIEATIISGGVLDRQFPDVTGLLRRIDLVHFLYCRIREGFFEHVPCAVAVPHIDQWSRVLRVRRADAIMYVATEWRDDMIRLGIPPDRLHPVSNGVDTDLFRSVGAGRRRALRKAMGLPADGFVVGFIAKRSSNLRGRKGPDMFAEGIRRLRTHVPTAVPLIIGFGWSDWVRDLERHGITPVWRRFIPDYRRLAQVYQCMDLFWMTARREGGPLTLLEAMASGVCCITTPTGMARDIVRDGVNGLSVPHGDQTRLVRLSVELAGDPGRRRRLGREGRRTIVEAYQWKETAKAVGDLYAAAIRRFAERTGRPLRRDLLAVIDRAAAGRAARQSTHYLSAVPARIRGRIQAAEAGSWTRRLVREGDTRAALRYGAYACAQQPFDAHTWRHVTGGLAAHVLTRREKKGSKRGQTP